MLGRTLLAAVLAGGSASAASAAPGYPLSLPRPPSGTMAEDRPAKPVDTLRDLYPALTACWEVPQGLAGFERTEITARFALRRDGSVIGQPRITFATQGADSRARALLTRATLDAIARCTPVAITPALGGAVAGRPLALRFIYHGPTGQGV